MRPHVSPFLNEPTVLRDAAASLGEPFWGPGAFLQDLELRLGLPTPRTTETERRQRYCMRLTTALSATRAEGRAPPFFARSFARDPLGTATTLLGWRDSLVEAGWDGSRIPACGPRVDALVDIELLDAEPLPLGFADRLARVELELGASSTPPYPSIVLLESDSAWSESWRRVLRSLELLGTRLDPRTRTPPARSHGDLADAKQWVLGQGERSRSCNWRGDGSVLLLSARTSWELGDAVVGLLRARAPRTSAVIRLGDASPLDAAFRRQGLPTQGHGSPSPLRGALQVVSLAMSLLFVPRDPYRALELLTLPSGPVPPYIADRLARAIGASPGVGGVAWSKAKAALATPVRPGDPDSVEAAARNLHVIEGWFEGPGFGRDTGAPKEAIDAALDRVAKWARGRLAGETDPFAIAVLAAVTELRTLVEAHPESSLLPHTLDRYVRRAVGPGVFHEIAHEEAGRIAHVGSPHAVHRGHDIVVVWHAGYDAQVALGRLPWRASEREALEAQGLRLPDRDALMEADARAWRRVLASTQQTFVVATPDVHLSDAQPNLPFWDEIVARCGATPRDVHLVRWTPDRLLALAPEKLASPIATALEPLALPFARQIWRIRPKALEAPIAALPRHSPSSLEPLFACPLRWVMESLLRIKPGGLSRVPDEEILYGTIGHRLVEVLHDRGLLGAPDRVATEAPALLADLLDREGGPLLLPGRVAEREQVRSRMLGSVKRLAEFLRANQLIPKAVEQVTEATWEGRKYYGRMDLVVERTDKSEIVVDLKWGSTRYRDALRKGFALQLAFYAETRRRETNASRPIVAAYYSLKNGAALALRADAMKRATSVNGPSLEVTWKRAEHAMKAGFARLEAGEIFVSACPENSDKDFLAYHALPPHPEDYNPPADAGCTYCSNASICGRKWTAL